MRDRFSHNAAVTPAMQARALHAVFWGVATLSSRGVRPVVEIDLDLSALMPIRRTEKALHAAGLQFGVVEIANAGRDYGILPGYTAEAWEAFLRQTKLDERYPGLSWRGPTDRGAMPSIYSAFHAAYWTTEWLIEDEPTPGLGEFTRRVEDAGGLVLFLSGRWLPEQVEPSLTALKRAGIAEPILLIGNPRHAENVSVGEKPLSDADIKRHRQLEVRGQYGVPVAVFDDRAANRDAVISANADIDAAAGTFAVLGVATAVPGFSCDAATERASLRVSTFETFTVRGPDPVRDPYLHSRYPYPADRSPYLGLYCGLGRNQ